MKINFRSVLMRAAIVLTVLLAVAACSAPKSALLVGKWTVTTNESVVDVGWGAIAVTVQFNSDDTWSWTESGQASSSGSGTYVADSSADTLTLVMKTTTSPDIPAGTTINATYSIGTDDSTATFTFNLSTGPAGSLTLAKQ